MSRIENFLKFLELDQLEVEILTSLIKYGELTILEISQKTQIERTKIYRITESLIFKGLITQRIEYKKKFFRICNTKILEDKAKEKLTKYENIKTNLPSIINKIEGSRFSEQPTNVKYYSGVSGIKQVLWNQLKAEKEILAFSYRDLIEIVGRRFFYEYKYEFEKRKLRLKDLRSIEFAKSTLKYKPIKLKGDIKRYIDPKILNIQTEIDIYDNTTTYFNWHKGEIYAIEIVDNKLANMHKQMFNTFWKLSSKYDRGSNLHKNIH